MCGKSVEVRFRIFSIVFAVNFYPSYRLQVDIPSLEDLYSLSGYFEVPLLILIETSDSEVSSW